MRRTKCQLDRWKHSRDLALLSVLLGYLVLNTTSTCSSTFYQCTTVPTLIENSQFFVILVLLKEDGKGWFAYSCRYYSVCLIPNSF